MLICLILGTVSVAGCGSSDSSEADAQETAEEAKKARETRQVKAELEEMKGSLKDCGAHVYAKDPATCVFAKNIQNGYYGEVASGSGPALGFHPKKENSLRLYCTGTVPHKCTGFKVEGNGIPSLKGAVVFFSP